MRDKRGTCRVVATWAVAVLALGGSVRAAEETQRIAREENRTQRIGEQTELVAGELTTIVEDLEINRLLTRQENADFVAARDGIDEIAKKEIRAVSEELLQARKALERARQMTHLRQTIATQERLIARLTEELVRIQYRSQLRYLLDAMRTIVVNQRQAIRTTQNRAIELAATDSEQIREEIQKHLSEIQDDIWHDWFLVNGQVQVMVARYRDLPFIDTLELFAAKARGLPIDQKLSETRDNLRSRRFGMAVTGQRLLAEYFLELLRILQSAGLSPAEQRSALEELIAKTEEALRQQQDLRQQTETVGRDLTEALREELAGQEDRLSAFTRDLAREADQVLPAAENPADPAPPQAGANPPAAPEPSESPSPAGSEKKQQENPWQEAQAEPADANAAEPSTAAAADLGQAADRMNDAADQLNQGNANQAGQAQQEAINNLAQALARMREQMDAADQADQLAALNDMLEAQGDVLDELGNIIREQQDLMGQTQETARAGAQGENAKAVPANAPPEAAADQPGEGQPPRQPGDAQGEAGTQPGEQPAAEEGADGQEPAGGEGAEAQPAAPAELAQTQTNLGDRTEDFAGRVAAATPAAPTLAQAVGQMDQAAAQLGEEQPAGALPHQGEALKALYKAERELAQALAEALDATEPMEWLDQMGNLDELINQIEQMAAEAGAMMPAPAPAMAQQAMGVAQQLAMMAGMPPAGPAMAAQMQQGGQMMEGAAGQLEEGQTGEASQTMGETAAMLRGLRGEMAAMMAAGLAQAMAQAMAQAAAQGQALSGQQLAAAAAQQGMQPSSRPAPGGRGRGMRGLGPTNFDPRLAVEKDLESGAWSRLPEREREEILQALKERYPARYERALIRYFRNLSRLEAER